MGSDWTPAVRPGVVPFSPSMFYSLGCEPGACIATKRAGRTERDVLTKPVLLSLAVLLSLGMFVQEQFNGTALWAREERWAEVRHLHVLH